MIFFITVLGIVLSILIFVYRAERFGPNLYFALFIFCHSFFAVTSFSFISNEFRWVITRIYPYSIIMNMAAGPFFYLYFEAVFKPDFKFNKYHLLHFLPSLLFFINASPFLFMDEMQKNQFIDAFMRDPSVAFRLPTIIVPYFGHIVFRMIQTFLYLVAGFRLFFISFRSNKFQLKNPQGYHYGYYILCFIFGFGFYSLAIYVGYNLSPSNRQFFQDGADLNNLIASPRFLNALFILSALFNPKLVFEKYFVETTKPAARPTKKRQQSVDPEAIKYDLQEIERLFTDYIVTKPYLIKGFSLNMISDGTKLPVHQISYFIKQHYDLTFNEWKNQQRIKHAVVLIHAGLAEQMTLETISMECGYRSRANFVDAFKKEMGITPSEYLANHNEK